MEERFFSLRHIKYLYFFLFCPDHPILNILSENLNACEFGDYFYKIIFTIWSKFFYRVFKDGVPIISKLKMVPKSPLNLRLESRVFTYPNRLSRSKRKIILRRLYVQSLDAVITIKPYLILVFFYFKMRFWKAKNLW